MSLHILVTGGAGYIGSHVCVALLEGGYQVTVIDNFSNSHPEAVARVNKIADGAINVIETDLADEGSIDFIRKEIGGRPVHGAIHLAGLKAVGESVAKPALYYHTNINSTLNLIEVMRMVGSNTVVFSSSATVYGEGNKNPLTETALNYMPTNPYGRTKLYNENILRDLYIADNDWRIANLRYFNPVGAHPSGLIGEDPQGIPNNLFPYIAQVAVGRREKLSVFGSDYPTRDGSGVRDYIHVQDLASGHVAALQFLHNQSAGCSADINLGTGKGVSVFEAIAAFERVSSRTIPFEVTARRPGDLAEVYADVTLASQLLAWQAQYDIDQMCADHWRWQMQNPAGYTG
ncbi:UDP-glucose 4-epimerase GalE [Parvularcula sp. IMCC14364]|uniref:UDP-glucose 4-epimerase GalE n=1 Tax=Parvularcula sp. IMCC14364 TaxID=3067902 RepID=UPI00274141A7|nr:UDP-glucose 4-epimerase GalE [Parvularcula sp. IMCC14364]